MPKKLHKMVKVQTYVPLDTLSQCKADAAAMSMSLSGYVAVVLRARFGQMSLKAPVPPTQLATTRSPGTRSSSGGTGGRSGGVPTGTGDTSVDESEAFAREFTRRLLSGEG